MKQDILDLPVEAEKPEESKFLKVVGVFRLLIGFQVLYTLLIGITPLLSGAFYAPPMFFWDDLLSLLFGTMINSLFIYYLITQGINEIKHQHLIHQRKYLKIFSLLITSRFILTGIWLLYNAFLSGLEQAISVIFVLSILLYITIWVQEIRYVFTKKQDPRAISED